ncbi:MAG: dihydrolipoyl dehydrogenase [Acidobacteria bacterium RIFCSPLOWO2_12_FULL_67_14b]|nr:MAG: dihydrolipoyl dehydrogenase [Acidobacteria bacterium RIFCSPLOWO2_12_FULL_67_14b]
MANEYDVVVIGAGTGGYVAAIRAAQLGLTVAVVERQRALGGTCLIWGCIPTKALLEHAHALKVAQGAKEWGLTGIDGAAVSIDMPAVHARKDKMVSGLTGGIEMLFKKNKIDWIKGSARLIGPHGVEVTLHDGGKQALTAKKDLVVATGSAPRSVPGIEADRKRIIFSDEAIHLPYVPKSIGIMGSGAVGVEFASIFKSYGSEVTVIELLPRLVPGEDEAVSAELERTFKKRGIKVLTGSTVTSATTGAKGVDIEVDTAGPSTGSGQGKSQTLAFDLLLVATGRGPVTEGLGAEALGLKMDRGYVVVDSMFRTNVPGISAIGDVITMGGPHYQLAHVSSMEGIVLAERIAGQAVQPINYDHVPRCTYSDPEIGSVGLTEAQAREQGHDVRIGTFPFRALARARMAGETDGFVKIVAEKKYDEVLGVHIIGPRATELVAEAVMALRMEVTVEELIRTIHAHPTMSEAVGEAAHAAHGAAIHI